jgi:hypothetical protein
VNDRLAKGEQLIGVGWKTLPLNSHGQVVKPVPELAEPKSSCEKA